MPVSNSCWIETIFISIKGNLWENEVIQMVLSCGKLGPLIM